jgi:16S rRNA (cytosine967-C5)-methyltransferase
MSNEGLVYAVEIHSARLRLVEKAAVRLGIDIIRAIKGDGRLAASLNLGSTGAVLVDAPCSGLGVIGRLPEIKWRRLPGKIPAFQKEQLALLYAAASILPPGGRLLYSVCSTEPEETSDVVSLFNQGHGEFIEEPVVDRLPEGLREKTAPGPAHHIWPDLHGLDGFFIALWRRR